MPFHMAAEDGNIFTFEGSPMPWKPLMRSLMRFERPMLTEDPFEHPPPASWEEAKARMESGANKDGGSEGVVHDQVASSSNKLRPVTHEL